MQRRTPAFVEALVARNRGRLGACLVLALLPLLLGHYELKLVITTMAYALAVLGLDFVIGRAGMLSFGQSAFLTLGAYTTTILMARASLPFGVAALVAVVVCGLAGVVLAVPATRLAGFSFGLVTFGFAIVASSLVGGNMLYAWTRGETGQPLPPASIFGVDLDPTRGNGLYYFTLVVFLVAGLIYGNLVYSRAGRALRTVRENEIVAATLGVPVGTYKVWAFGIGAAFAGAAGIVIALTTAYVSPASYSIDLSVYLVAMTILGGATRALGPLVGAAFFVFLPQYLASVRDNSAIIFSAIFLVTLIVAPQGVMGIVESLLRRIRIVPRRRSRPLAPAEGTE